MIDEGGLGSSRRRHSLYDVFCSVFVRKFNFVIGPLYLTSINLIVLEMSFEFFEKVDMVAIALSVSVRGCEHPRRLSILPTSLHNDLVLDKSSREHIQYFLLTSRQLLYLERVAIDVYFHLLLRL